MLQYRNLHIRKPDTDRIISIHAAHGGIPQFFTILSYLFTHKKITRLAAGDLFYASLRQLVGIHALVVELL